MRFCVETSTLLEELIRFFFPHCLSVYLFNLLSLHYLFFFLRLVSEISTGTTSYCNLNSDFFPVTHFQGFENLLMHSFVLSAIFQPSMATVQPAPRRRQSEPSATAVSSSTCGSHVSSAWPRPTAYVREEPNLSLGITTCSLENLVRLG